MVRSEYCRDRCPLSTECVRRGLLHEKCKGRQKKHEKIMGDAWATAFSNICNNFHSVCITNLIFRNKSTEISICHVQEKNWETCFLRHLKQKNKISVLPCTWENHIFCNKSNKITITRYRHVRKTLISCDKSHKIQILLYLLIPPQPPDAASYTTSVRF